MRKHARVRVALAGILLPVLSAFLGLVSGEVTAENGRPPRATDLQLVRKRLLDGLLKSPNSRRARSAAKSQRADGSWPDVDYEDRTRSGWKTYRHLSHLLDMACAYKSSTSPNAGDR